MSNNNQYLNIVWDQVTKKLLNANVLDAEIAPLPPNIMPIEIAIAEKNPLEAINRQVLANRRSLGIAGRELNAIVTPVEELEAIQQLETAKLAIYALSLIISMLQGVVNFLSSFGVTVKSICIHCCVYP